MESVKNVELVKKANIYFDGNVTSRTFIEPNGDKKTLGIMMVWKQDGSKFYYL